MKRILIANRGEIARRVIRTAHDMGIETVAVFSEPDASLPHVHEATLAVPLGGTASADSYLRVAEGSGVNAFVVDIVDGTAVSYASPVMQQYSPSAYAAKRCS